MADKTGIEWTDATWNPVTGCAKVSAGCKHCYAERNWGRLLTHPKMRGFVGDAPWPLPNVWIGVSVEDQATADKRIPLLLVSRCHQGFQ